MQSAQALDESLFFFINQRLSNPLFDWLMPLLNWNAIFIPALLLLTIALVWKGGTRAQVFLIVVILVVALGDSLICNQIKRAVNRPRPFYQLADVKVRGGKGGTGSMPSSHAANWFAATATAWLFFRRSWRFLLPAAATIGFSRIYNGMHYPSDVLAGAILGTAYAVLGVHLLDRCWRGIGPRWFPLWWQKLPSLLEADLGRDTAIGSSKLSTTDSPDIPLDQHWVRFGYVLILGLLLARLGYLASGTIELSEDEAYQWLWSKHLALSYYSKPPLIAYTQFLGTALWGDNAFGVRFFSPVIAATISLVMLRFLATQVNAVAALMFVAIVNAIPLMAVGATLMTIDSLSVLFWCAAFVAGWHAIRRSSTPWWIWTGIWMGLGFLSKYTALFQCLCWLLFFVLWKPARAQLRTPGPYLALLINLLLTLPVLIWNYQHEWITLAHLKDRGGLSQPWHFTVRYFLEFSGAELGLLNPVYFLGILWAAISVWRFHRGNSILLYFFCMGTPLFLFYWIYTFRARVQPNWIAPSVVPLSCLMLVYWQARWRTNEHRLKPIALTGFCLGLTAVVFLHETNLVEKLAGRPLPAKIDPLRRVRGFKELARIVGEERDKLLSEGKPVFIIGAHYGITSLVSFYLPEARAGLPDNPLVYFQSSSLPKNQFYFWPGYRDDRMGQNAIYVRQGEKTSAPPLRLLEEFATVTDLGMRDVRYHNKLFHQVQLFACKGLR